jgi:predicted membrane protein
MHFFPAANFVYPNETELPWSILIVLYPYLTGLVAGAFILASLERVFRVEAVKPTYRLALLTALSFLLVAPLPLQLHLGHPERSLEMYLTPHRSSAMAMFGFVYLWYLMGVLVLEIWLDYRRDIVLLARSSKGFLRVVYKAMTLGSDNISERRLDHHHHRNTLGIPAARLCRIHLRIHQGQPVVVESADAGGVYFFGHGFRYCGGDAALHAAHQNARLCHQHRLRRCHRQISLLHLHHRFQP